MKRIIFILFAFAITGIATAQEARNELNFNKEEKAQPTRKQEDYHFSVSYRLQAGYSQDWQFQQKDTATNIYLHGANVGVTFDFNLPYRLSIQTGVIYSMTTSHHEQHWVALSESIRDPQVMDSWIYKHNLNIPVYLFYRQPLWKELALVFYTGPAFNIGVNQLNKLTPSMDETTLNWMQSQNLPTESYERYDTDLQRFNLQYGLGGGIEWANYRLQSGYAFGLNNLSKAYTNKSYEWGWYVSFSYRLK